jgi:ABC-type transport system substrate-binding protein
MKLKANPYSPWWSGKTITIPVITVQLFADEAALVNALAAGSVDAALVNPNDVSALANVQDLHIANTIGLWGPYFHINAGKGYPLNNTYFRQGLMYLLPKDQINTILYNGQGQLGNAMMINPSSVKAFWPGPNTPIYNFSIPDAVTSFQRAGLTRNGQGQWVTPDGKTVSLELSTESNDPNFIRMAQFIQSAMQLAGLTITIKTVDVNTQVSDWVTQNFETMIMPWSESTPWLTPGFKVYYPGLVNDTIPSTYKAAFTDTNLTRGLETLKKLDLMAAQLAMNNVILLYPQIVAYSTKTFTGWTPAISETANGNLILSPVFASNVLTSIQPLTASTTTVTSTSTSVTTSTSVATSTSTATATSISTATSLSTIISTTSTTATVTTEVPGGSSTTTLLAIAGVILVAVIIGALALRRRQPKT